MGEKSRPKFCAKGIESWCPTQKKERQWSDRKKIIEEPLFKSYVFVKATKEEYNNVLSTMGVVRFLYFEKASHH